MRLQTILALGVATSFLAGSAAFAEHEGKGKFHSTTQAVRVGEFLGATVVDQTGERIGQLKDIILQPQTGKADLAIVSLSMPNQTDKLTAIPWQLIQVTEPNRLMVTTDRSKLMSATTFDSTRWPEFDTAYNQRIYTYYGLTYPVVAVGAGPSYGGEIKGPVVTTKENEPFRRPQPDGKDTFQELNKSPERYNNNRPNY
ncbi:MAG TPA: PRC-barrel domain-containing protein [Candidatus Binatia bacterium]|nr:PRC-barrel domain-containing protein [Candidatus Binatia bacterium]